MTCRGADGAGRAGLVVDDERLAEGLVAASGAIVRAMESVEPPGGNGTTRVTGFDGQACASAPDSGREADDEGSQELLHGMCLRECVVALIERQSSYGSATNLALNGSAT